MLHKLALATQVYSEEELLEKLAIISREEHFKALARDEQKARELAKLRGVKIPEGKPISEVRVSPERGKAKKPPIGQVFEGGKVKTKWAPDAPALKERLIQEEFGDVAQSKLKQLRHKTVGPARRFWAGRNALGGPWKNRLALLGALGASGLGVKAYLDANKAPAEMDSDWKGAGSYVQDAAFVPKPPSQPKVSPPTTKPPSALAASTRSPGAPGVPTPGPSGISGGESSQDSSGKTATSALQRAVEKKADAALFPLLAGGAGGLGSYMLAENFLTPYIKQREQMILEEILKRQQSVKNLQKIRQYVPFGAAAAGALLLAALAAKKAKDSVRNQQQGYSVNQHPLQAYDPSEAGFNPEDLIQFGAPPGFY